ncbi:MAG: ABC transporter permease [Acidobacteria bacterium]|nr:ABC transporter permease [Acidobacteriota bacterium]
MAAVLRDIRYALRTIRKAPMYAVVTVLMLGIGIGANVTVFSIVDRFVLGHPPVADPSALMMLHTTRDGHCCGRFSWPTYADVRDRARSFAGVAAYYELLPAAIGGYGDPERVWGQAVTANYFDVARLAMFVGRGFTPAEEHLPVVVISHRLWTRRFGADPSIVGRAIPLSGRPYTVVGVAPEGFRGVDVILDAQYWVTLDNLSHLEPRTDNRRSRDYQWLAAVGRLAPGTSRRQAEAELKLVGALIARQYPASTPAADRDSGFVMEVAGSLPPRQRAAVIAFLASLSAVSLMVLAIACVNVTNLSLARAAVRRREMAMRVALGASRGPLLRQMLTESILLSFGGGLLGVFASHWAARALSVFHMAAPVPLDTSIAVSGSVLPFAFLLSAGAGLLFGLAPAWAASRPDIAAALKGEELLTRTGHWWGLRNILVAAEVAMSTVLLCATGLFLRSLSNAAHIDTGFRSGGVLMMSVDPRLHGYSPERSVELLRAVRERVASVPGVQSVAWTDAAPLSGGHRSDGFDVVGKPGGGARIVDLFMATPGYFETLGIPLLAGRAFENDSASSARVAVVNQYFATHFFPNEEPIGQRVRDGDRVYQIVGVVRDTKSRTIGEEQRAILFRALEQDIAADPSGSGYTLMIRVAADPVSVASAAQSAVHAIDPALAVFGVATMEQHMTDALFLPRLAGTLFGVFGLLGLTLAGIGLYSIIDYWVSRRRREIGIRVAIGARPGAVQALILRQGMTLAAAGIAPGIAAAWALSRLLTSFLYGVAPNDAATFGAISVFLLVVTFVACWIPSRRAAAVDPSLTLRCD